MLKKKNEKLAEKKKKLGDEKGADDDELSKIINDPLVFLNLKPIGKISNHLTCVNPATHQKFHIKEGNYYFVPQFQETRVFRYNASLETFEQTANNSFELICSNLYQTQVLAHHLKNVIQNHNKVVKQMNTDNQLEDFDKATINECNVLHESLQEHMDQMKKFEEAEKIAQASRFRKMQTLERQYQQRENQLRRMSRREDMINYQQQKKQNSERQRMEEESEVYPEYGNVDKMKSSQAREKRLQRRINAKEGHLEDESPKAQVNTMSGRQNKKPKYLQDYDDLSQQDESDEDFEESDQSDEDDSGEEYVNGRYRNVRGRGRGGRGRGRGAAI